MPKIVKEMAPTAWQKEMARIETLKARIQAEDNAQQVLAKDNLVAALAAFEQAEGENKVLVERVLFRAMVCEQEMRSRMCGVMPYMSCAFCSSVRGRGNTCAFCDRWRQALYGGDGWVSTGYYYGSQL